MSEVKTSYLIKHVPAAGVPGCKTWIKLTSSSMTTSWAMDYGQFELWTDYLSDDLDTEVVYQRAVDGDHIAQQDHLLVVTCPQQNNFEMPLRLERWSAGAQHRKRTYRAGRRLTKRT